MIGSWYQEAANVGDPITLQNICAGVVKRVMNYKNFSSFQQCIKITQK